MIYYSLFEILITVLLATSFLFVRYSIWLLIPIIFIQTYVYYTSYKNIKKSYYKSRLVFFSFVQLFSLLQLYDLSKYNLITNGHLLVVNISILTFALLIYLIIEKVNKIGVIGIIVSLIFLTVNLYTITLLIGISYSKKDISVTDTVKEILIPTRDLLFIDGIYSLNVEYIADERNINEVILNVSREYYDNAKIGDEISCDVYSGLFGIEYITINQ